MPNEPEREIEKTLKAYADKRRAEAGAPRELHPATRRLLQAEAARVHGSKPGGASFWARVFRGGLPQLAVGFGALILLGVTISILITNSAKEKRANANYAMANSPADLMPPQQKEDLRLQAKPTGRVDSFKSEMPAASAPAYDAEKSSMAARKVAEKDNQTKIPAASTAAPQPAKPSVSTLASRAASEPVALDKTLASNDHIDVPVIAPATPAPAPVIRQAAKEEPAPTAVAIAGATISGSDVKKFARTDLSTAVTKSSRNRVRLLSSFQVETTGNHIRIVDSDGSVYTGALENADRRDPTGTPPGSAGNSEARKTDAITRHSFVAGSVAPHSTGSLATNAVGLEVSNFVFRVSGTNLSRNQPVVFTGTFVGNVAADANSSSSIATFGGAGVAGESGLVAKTTNMPTPLRMLNLRISGRATVGTNSVNISAKAEEKK